VEQSVAMGKSATPRLGDFAQLGLAIEAKCSCGHGRSIPAAFLEKLVGVEARLYPFVLDELAQRFTCSACHTRGPTLSVVRTDR
jgi:hypothetical protein